MTEDQILLGCLDHDRQCQQALYNRFSPQMYSVCLRYCSCNADAQEALQNGFIRVYKHLHSYNKQGKLGAWIRKIVVRSSLDQIRTTKKNQTVGYEELLAEPHYAENHETMTYAEMLLLLDKLPERNKIIFSMYVLDDYSHAEIAETLQINEVTSRSLLFKTRKLLQNQLPKHWYQN
jgi:RNA polymerase sigma factor (sigma-70 family)